MKKLLYFIWIFTFLGIFLFVPNVGKNAFTMYGIRSVVLIILGISPFIAIIISFINEKNVAEALTKYSKAEMPFTLLKKEKITYGIVAATVLALGIFNLSFYIKDLNIGPQQITLRGCTVNRQHVTSRGGGNTKYYLEGWNLTNKYRFNLHGLNKATRESLTKTTGTIDITYYPNTKVLVNFQYEIDPNKTQVSYKASTQAYVAQNNTERMRELAQTNGNNIGAQPLHDDNMNSSDSSENSLSALDELIAESNLPFELLSKATAPDNYSNTNRQCNETADGFALAYCGHFPMDSEDYVINKITIRGGDYNVFGFKVGDKFDNDFGMIFINKHYKMEIHSFEHYCYPAPEGCNEYIQSKGNVVIYIYYDESRIIKEMRVYITDGNILYLDYDKDAINTDYFN